MATLIYTSGTTGTPKAVMLSHDNLTWTAQAAAALVGGQSDDQVISYLPLSHIAEQIVVAARTDGVRRVRAGSRRAWRSSATPCGRYGRTIFLGVPRVWEKIQEKMVAAGAQNPPLKKKIVAWARGQGLAGGYAEQQRESKPLALRIRQQARVREGPQATRARSRAHRVTSAAPISRDTLEFFLSLGAADLRGVRNERVHRPGDVVASGQVPHRQGGLLPARRGAQDRRGRRGLHARPARVQGLLQGLAATAEALDKDGWLHSGDIGTIDAQGFLQITDRKKDLIITAGGENIAPALVEGYIKGIPVVSQAVVIGDRQRYLSVLLTLNAERIKTDAESCGSAACDPETAARDERFLQFLQRQIDAVNARLARVQAVKKFKVIPKEFTIEGGELTPTMKVKRKVVTEKYRKEIDQLYS